MAPPVTSGHPASPLLLNQASVATESPQAQRPRRLRFIFIVPSVALACFLLYTAFQVASDSTSMDLVLLKDAAEEDGAVCLDGTPAGYYFSKGFGTGENSWVVHLQGGGWCYTPESCARRARTSKGSSLYWPASAAFAGQLQNNKRKNPDFYNWNHVYIRYCDGGSYAGDRNDTVEAGGMKLYFRGHRILRAVFRDLIQNNGLDTATELQLTGVSAGGMAALLHANTVRAMIPESARFGVVPISGYFVPVSNLLGENVYASQMRDVFEMQNASAGVQPECLATHTAEDAWQCLFATEAYKHLTVPVFVVNSMYDSWSVRCILSAGNATNADVNCSAVPGWRKCAEFGLCSKGQVRQIEENWGKSFRSTIESSETYSKRGNGAFLSSCYAHSGSDAWNVVSLGGHTARQAIGSWWRSSWNDTAAEHTRKDCSLSSSICCNPSCCGKAIPAVTAEVEADLVVAAVALFSVVALFVAITVGVSIVKLRACMNKPKGVPPVEEC